MSCRPACSPDRRSRTISCTVMPNAGRMTTSSGPSARPRSSGIAQEADAVGAQAIVDVRVVDDLAGQEDAGARGSARPPGRRSRPRGRRRSRSRTPREMDGQPPFVVTEAGGADLVDEAAVIGRGELSRNGLLHVEALAEDQWLRVLTYVRGPWPRGSPALARVTCCCGGSGPCRARAASCRRAR